MRRFKNATNAFESLYQHIMKVGLETEIGTKAIYNEVFEIYNPDERIIKTPWRKFNKSYADFESAWYFTQDRTWNMIGEAAKIWNSMGDQLNSNYGWAIQREQQFAKVINLLAEDKHTRRAIVTIYDGKEICDYKDDTPCCLNFGFNIINNKLNMTIHFRSQDLVFGFCNDQYTLFEYHKLVFDMLVHKRYPELELGSSFWMVNDLHIYERHYKMKDA